MTYLFNMWREYFQGCTGESPISERSSGDGGSDKDGFYSLLKGNEKKISPQYLFKLIIFQLRKGGHSQYFSPICYVTVYGNVCMSYTINSQDSKIHFVLVWPSYRSNGLLGEEEFASTLHLYLEQLSGTLHKLNQRRIFGKAM
jgi:hypothetical protein